MVAIEAIQVAGQTLQPAMSRITQQAPVKLAAFRPFALLTKLAPHEHQLLARCEGLPGQQQAQVGEALPGIAGHFADQRTFAMHDFIMRERQHVVFAVGINLAEGEFVVMPAPIDWVTMKIAQAVVHPAHIPFHRKTKAANVGGA